MTEFHSNVFPERAAPLDFLPRGDAPTGELGGKLLARESDLHRIIVVGGGAGGLELVTRLGNTLGRRGQAEIFLADKYLHHLWKPLLHEVAAGTLRLEDNEVTYLGQARAHHFRFRFGTMEGMDRTRREIYLAPTLDEDGNEVSPRRIIPYDTLVLAVGSVTNDFGIPGVKEYAWPLNEPRDARRFHRRLLAASVHCQILDGQEPLDIVIVGAGATGVELAAELHQTVREFVSYGLDKIDPGRIRITLVSSTPRILPGLPEALSAAVHAKLASLGIEILCNERVVKIEKDAVLTASGKRLPALVTVWAGGIKAPDFLAHLGLETNRMNQLVVDATLRTGQDEHIYALGDCAAAPWLGREPGTLVPPRAQAAHQQATLLAKSLQRQLTARKPALEFQYRDFGSLVSLGRYEVLGNLMGKVGGRGMMVHGLFARFMYWFLYQKHLMVLNGVSRVFLSLLARMIARSTQPRVKLH